MISFMSVNFIFISKYQVLEAPMSSMRLLRQKLRNSDQCLLRKRNHVNHLVRKIYSIAEAYYEPCRTSKIEPFAKKVNGFQPLTVFAESSILDV